MSLGVRFKPEFRIILQDVMIRKIVRLKALEESHGHLLSDDSNLEGVICKINETLNSLHQRIKICQCELTGDTVCVFTSTVDREYQKKYKLFTGPQEEYFLLIVQFIVCSSENGFIGSVDALNLSSKMKTPMTRSLAEEYLQLYLRKGYILVDSCGKYCLSMLAITELESYFTNFEDYLTSCVVCKRLAFICLKCDHCEKSFHKLCFSNFNQYKSNSVCPSCKKELLFSD